MKHCRKYSGGSSAPENHYSTRKPAKRQRGFIHILLLVFTILGISLWGISEMVQRRGESVTEKEKSTVTSLNEVKRLVLNYALIAPPRLEVEKHAGRYEAYTEGGYRLPFRYFSLPCPDIIGRTALGGVSDIVGHVGGKFRIFPCDSLVSRPLLNASTTGLLPWQTFSGAIVGSVPRDIDFVYARGVGDVSDNNGDRFWYSVSPNFRQSNTALNPHWLLRQDSFWYNVIESPSNKTTERVAAIVYSPGLYTPPPTSSLVTFRIDNVGDAGSTSPQSIASEIGLSSGNYNHFAHPYLESINDLHNIPFLNTVTSERRNLNINVEKPPLASYSDRISYITVEELAEQGGAGIEELYGEGSHFFDIPGGQEEFFGVTDLMRAHFNRYGYLPAPAPFTESAATSRNRPGGIPFITNVELETETRLNSIRGGAVTEDAGEVITVVLPLSSIRKIYLQKDTLLRVNGAATDTSSLPPYNLALYQMDTDLNQNRLVSASFNALVAGGHYPEDLFGFRSNPMVFATAVFSPPSTPAAQPREIPLDSRVFRSITSNEEETIDIAREQQGLQGVTIFAALAEATHGYILGDSFGNNVGIKDSSTLGILNTTLSDQTPQFGFQVRLPVGTQLTIQGNSNIMMELPRNLDANGIMAGPLDDQFILLEQAAQPVRFISDSSRVVTVLLPAQYLPIVSSDTGFLPIDNLAVEYIRTTNNVVFGSTRLSGSDEAMTVHGGVTLAHIQPISYLPVEMEFVTNEQLIIAPLPPANMAFDNLVRVPTPLYVNRRGRNDRNQQGVFTLPAGTQIFYPPRSTINLGSDFAFPPGTRALLPRGSQMRELERPDTDITKPGGRTFPRGNRRIINGVFDFPHGAVLNLFGQAHRDTVNPRTRIVLKNGLGIHTDQELFDIELQTSYTAGTVTYNGGVLQPLTGRQLHKSIAPIPLDDIIGSGILDGARLRFLTRPRNLPIIRTGLNLSNTTITLNPGERAPSGIILTLTTTLVIPNQALIANIPLGGEEAIDLPVGVQAGNFTAGGVDTFNFRINEETYFTLPTGIVVNIADYSTTPIVSDLGTQNLVEEFVFPVGTQVFDSSFENLDNINVSGRSGVAILEMPLTVTLARAITEDGGRGIIINQLLMNNIEDYFYTDSVGVQRTILANSDIDIVRGVAWPPGSIRSFPSVAEDLRAISSEQMVMYFAGGVLLTTQNRGDFMLSETAADNMMQISFQNQTTTLEIFDGVLPDGMTVEMTQTVAFINTVQLEWFEIRTRVNNEFVLHRTNALGVPGDGSFRLPPGTFIIVPAGSTLDFLSPSRHDDAGFSAETADIAFLPPGVIAVIPPRSNRITIVRTDGTLETISGNGPGDTNDEVIYMRLGGDNGNRFAMVAHSDFLPISPIIDFIGDTYLVEAERSDAAERDKRTSYIPAGSRGDIFGNITQRNTRDFGTNMLPTDSGEFLRNFPMVYAVAPDCRQGVNSGKDCAEDGKGLEFEVGGEELVVLEDDMVAAGNIYIEVATGTQPGRDAGRILNVEVWDLGNFNARATRKGVGGVRGIYVDRNTGSVSFSGEVTAPPVANPTDVLLISRARPAAAVDNINDAEVRVYMLDEAVELDDIIASPPILEDAHYALMEVITIHVGGYTDGRQEEATGRITLRTTHTTVTRGGRSLLQSNFQIGYGAQVIAPSYSANGKELFGADSYIDLTVQGANARLELDEYHVLTPESYGGTIQANSRYASFDYGGNVLNQALRDDIIIVQNEGEGGSVIDSALGTPARPSPTFIAASNAFINMEQGYLWQGYINPKGGRATVTLNFSPDERYSARDDSELLPPEAFIRVHPQAELLNFWGSGMERLEGLDNRSIARSQERFQIGAFPGPGPGPGRGSGSPVSFEGWVDTNAQSADALRFSRDVVHLGASAPDGYPIPASAYSFNDGERTQPLTDDNVVYAGQGERPAGFRSAVYGDGSRNIRHITLRVRVWDEDGNIVNENLTGRWTPYSSVMRVRDPLPSAPPFTTGRGRREGFLSWGYTNHPFDIMDQSYASTNEDVWAVRKTANPYNPTSKFDENAQLRLTINGERLDVFFNAPAYQMTGKRIAHHVVTEYPRFAHITFPIRANELEPHDGVIYKCDPEAGISFGLGGTPPLDSTTRGGEGITRVPGVLLGPLQEVEKPEIVRGDLSGRDCDIVIRSASFSSRPRRNSVPATYANHPEYIEQLGRDAPERTREFGVNNTGKFVTAPREVITTIRQPEYQYIDITQPLVNVFNVTFSFGMFDVFGTEYRNNGITPVVFNITVNSTISNIRTERIRFPNLVTIRTSNVIQQRDLYAADLRVDRDSPLGLLGETYSGFESRQENGEFRGRVSDDSFEVRAVSGSQPTQFHSGDTPPITTPFNDVALNPASYTVPLQYIPSTVFVSVTIDPSIEDDMSFQLASREERSVPLDADIFFYLDLAYNSNLGGDAPRSTVAGVGDDYVVAVDSFPPQTLFFGDNFEIQGPGAFVPHFGGQNEEAVRQTYAARSRFMNTLFEMGPSKALHDIYSDVSYSCPSEIDDTFAASGAGGGVADTCQQIYNPDNAPYWIPIISGIVAFEQMKISLSGTPANLDDLEVFMVLPQPEARVRDSNGNMRTIHAGSIIEPRSGLIRPSIPIARNSRLHIFEEAIAAVDVSPVNTPTPIEIIRGREQPFMRAWDFNYAPIRATTPGGDVYYVEPKHFVQDYIIDFANTLFVGERLPRGLPFNCTARNEYSCNPFRVTSGRQVGYRVHETVRATIRYDGTLSRGFLMNQQMASLQNDYYSGAPVFSFDNGFRPHFPHRFYSPGSNGIYNTRWFDELVVNSPPRGDANHPNSNYNFDPGNEAAPLGNPLSWHWLSRLNTRSSREALNIGNSFIPMGASRQFAVSYDSTGVGNLNPLTAQFPRIARFATASSVYTGSQCGSLGVNSEDPVLLPASPTPVVRGIYARDRTPFVNLPCFGEAAHYWVGMIPPDSTSNEYPHPTVALQIDNDEFVALRLPHQIQIPEDTIGMAIPAYSGSPQYPSTDSAYFTFPANSVANILNVDSSSWESVHPYASRYLSGAVFSNEGGFYPQTPLDYGVAVGPDASEIAAARGFFSGAEEIEIQENNDGHRRLDVSGKRVMHYSRTESTPGNYAKSNTAVYTNVWIRLINGGSLTDDRGDVIYLPRNTMVNPVLGTYLPGEESSLTPEKLTSNYQAFGTLAREMEVIHPALIIPKGVTVRVGTRGGNIRDVKAAAMFSLTPLQNIECASGGVDNGFFLGGLLNTVVINQSREGVSEFALQTTTGTAANNFSLANPCAWLDDRENTDGDRFFIYRNRRRFVEPYKTRVVSNDRTYLLGGKLTLNVL